MLRGPGHRTFFWLRSGGCGIKSLRTLEACTFFVLPPVVFAHRRGFVFVEFFVAELMYTIYLLYSIVK